MTKLLFFTIIMTRKGETKHPGRHMVALLALTNLGLWLVDTFELQKSRASLAEEHFYGPIVWVAIQRITLPICIFFRHCTMSNGHVFCHHNHIYGSTDFYDQPYHQVPLLCRPH